MGTFETMKNWAKKKKLEWVRGMRALVPAVDSLQAIKANPS
jgi:hypothetical protein